MTPTTDPPTMPDYTAARLEAMDDRELDALAALVVAHCRQVIPADERGRAIGEDFWVQLPAPGGWGDLPRYTVDHNAAAVLLQEVAQRHQQKEFILALDTMLQHLPDWADAYWRYITLSPRQKTIACLLAVSDVERALVK